jgi:hypothetical protein
VFTWNELVAQMAAIDGAPERLLREHVPTRFDRCRACRTSTGIGERWPCRLHSAAEAARNLRLGRAGP